MDLDATYSAEEGVCFIVQTLCEAALCSNEQVVGAAMKCSITTQTVLAGFINEVKAGIRLTPSSVRSAVAPSKGFLTPVGKGKQPNEYSSPVIEALKSATSADTDVRAAANIAVDRLKSSAAPEFIIEVADAEIAALRSTVKEKEEELCNLNRRLMAMNNQIGSMCKDIDARDGTISGLTNTNQELAKQCEMLTNRADDVDSLQARLEEAQEVAGSLKAELTRLHEVLAVARCSEKELQNKVDEHQTTEAQHRDEYRVLLAELGAANSRLVESSLISKDAFEDVRRRQKDMCDMMSSQQGNAGVPLQTELDLIQLRTQLSHLEATWSSPEQLEELMADLKAQKGRVSELVAFGGLVSGALVCLLIAICMEDCWFHTGVVAIFIEYFWFHTFHEDEVKETKDLPSVDEKRIKAEKEEEGINAGNSDTLKRPHKEQSPRRGTIV